MLIPLGFLDFPTGAASSFDLLQTYTLASSQASVTFSSLGDYAATYQHLQIRMVTRGTRADAGSQIWIRINGDSGTSYRWHNLYGNGSNVQSGTIAEAGIWGGWTAGNTAPANAFGAGVLDLLDPFTPNKYPVIRLLSGVPNYPEVGLTSGMRLNTEAVTSIEIRERTGANLAANCRFSLYGLRSS